MEEQKVAKVAKIYNCDICDCKCSGKYNYNKHLSTLKHKNTEMSKMSKIEEKKVANVANVAIVDTIELFTCDCGKEYKQKYSLTRHKKTCDYDEPVCVEIKKTTDVSGDLVAILMEQNREQSERLDKKDKQLEAVLKSHDELTKKVVDMMPYMGSNNSNNSNNTNNFNINMFLNEECKDAINMSDFIKSIQVSLEQLQYTTSNGLGKGITKVIMDNMNKLSKYERPLHCSDLKRETLYIKDNDIWEKDTNKEKLKKVINKTSNKNYTALSNWTKENPTFMKQDDKQMFYAKTSSQIGKSITGVEDKIIKSICKDNQVKE